MLHYETTLRFQCTACGACCTGGGDSGVFMSDAEAERIRAALGVSPAWFRRRYVRRVADGEWEARLGADGACPFLAGGRRCAVYALRPGQCRSYPFWPELLASRGAWRREARRCEGIGRGPAVDVQTIERRLRQAGWRG